MPLRAFVYTTGEAEGVSGLGVSRVELVELIAFAKLVLS